MCFNNNFDAKRAAKRERQRIAAEEAARKAGILQGQTNIDEAFGKFDDAYLDDYADAYRSNYFPDLENQFTAAKDKLIAALAGKGVLNSTVGAKRLADLSDTYNKERTAIATRANDARNDLHSKIESQKSDLYSLNNSAADPTLASNRAGAAVTALAAPQTYSPLGDVFAAALQPVAAYVSADRNSVSPRLPFNQQPTVYSSPTKSSGRIVQ